MVPFHDRWIQSQFKDEINIEKMKKRLLERAEREVGVGHWLTDLVNELSVSPDTPLSPKFHFDRVTEALNELKENNSEIFEGVFFSPEEDKQVEKH